MTGFIRAITEVSIPQDMISEFKKLASEVITRVEATESYTLSYEWFLSNDESKCYVVHLYKDSESLLAHLRNIGDLGGPLHEIAPINDLMIFGSPSDELRQALEPVGAKIFEHWNGVTR